MNSLSFFLAASSKVYVPTTFVSINGFGFDILLSTWLSAAKFTITSISFVSFSMVPELQILSCMKE